MAARFWVGGTGVTSDTSHWSATTGGAGGATVPGSADTVTFDANSGAAATVTHDVAATWSTLTLNKSDLLLTQAAALIVTGAFALTTGSYKTNGFAATWGSLSTTNTNTRALDITGSTVVITSGGTATVWSLGTTTGMTLTTTGSSIQLTGAFTGGGGSFSGGGLQYNHVRFSHTGVVLHNGANSYTGNLTVDPAVSVVFRRSIVVTLLTGGNFIAWGSAGNVPNIASDLAGTAWTLACSTRTYVWCDWSSFKDTVATGTYTFYAGANSTDAGGNTGLIFTQKPIGGTAASASSAAGALRAATQVSGTAASVSGASGALRAATRVSGTAASVSSASGALRAATRVSGTANAVSTAAGTVNAYSRASKTQVRERPPLRTYVTVDQVDRGSSQRWAADESDPRNVLVDETWSDTMPGGYEHFGAGLVRTSKRDYSDLMSLERLTVRGVGGEIAWQGRLDQRPAQDGDSLSISPSAVGFVADLDDDSGVRMIPIDKDFSAWQAATVSRKIALITALIDNEDSQTYQDQTTGEPSLETGFQGSWLRTHESEAWYDAAGIPLDRLYVRWKLNGIYVNTGSIDPNWTLAAYLCDDDVASGSPDSSGNMNSSGYIYPGWPGYGETVVAMSTATRKWALVQLFYSGAGGVAGQKYALDWTTLAVVGYHPGITIQGSFPNIGVFASDVIAYGLGRWAPHIGFVKASGPTFDDEATIQQSSYVIPHLPFKDTTTLSQVVQQSTRFESPDWAIWDRNDLPAFYLNTRNARGRRWVARAGPCKLSNTGPQAANMWNGVIVTYTDTTGITRTVGPPGSGATVEDASLFDSDPENPVTKAGYIRNAPVAMGTSEAPIAIRVGGQFLQGQKLLTTAGSAEFVGYIEDEHGILWPAWMAKSGDQVKFVDASDTGWRRIVRKEWAGSTKTASVTLDAPPDGMQQLLERLSLALLSQGAS